MGGGTPKLEQRFIPGIGLPGDQVIRNFRCQDHVVSARPLADGKRHNPGAVGEDGQGRKRTGNQVASRRIPIPTTNDGQFHTYFFHDDGEPLWDGSTITGVRFDPNSNADNSTFELDFFLASDGDSDLFERIAGTNPDDNGDRLEVTAAVTDAAGGGLQLELHFDALAGRHYQLWASTTMAPGSWGPGSQWSAVSDGPVVLTDTVSGASYFFRLGISLPLP